MSARLAGTLISGALLGKLLGFAREIEMARLIGASIVADSFRGAMTAVLLPVAPIQSDMLPSVLIPMHRTWTQNGDAAVRSAAFASLVTALAAIIALGVYCLAAPWIGVLVGHFDGEAQALTIRFVRVMSLAIPASVLSACLAAVEIAVGRSRIAAIRASTQNVGMMIGIAVMAWFGQPIAIAWSFVLTFNIVAAYGLVILAREGALSLTGLRVGMVAEVGLAFWRRFRPLLGIPIADQGNIVLERMLASGLAVGALASLDYARTLTDSAFYLISQPIGYVVLSRAAGRPHTTRDEVEHISTRLLALGVPVSVFIALFAPDIVTVVFARGAFDAHAVMLTSAAMRGIAIGLWATMLGWVLVRLLNAAGRNGVAAVVIISAYAANAAFNVLAVPTLGTLGLGLGEATRGFVLLGGTTLALGHGRLMLRCTLKAGAITLPLAVAGLSIASALHDPLARLAVVGPLFGIATVAWLAVLLPDQRRWALALVRRPLGLAPRG